MIRKPSQPNRKNVNRSVAPEIDRDYLADILRKLLDIPSPSGYTDNISRFVCEELERLKLEASLTRRGAIRATMTGQKSKPRRAIVGHLDTLGAMVRKLKPNGRLEPAPIGTWSARFAEGARVTIYTDHGHQRGTILPLKSSGHAYDKAIDEQPVAWDNLEVRVDDLSRDEQELFEAGFRVGDYIAVDPQPEFLDNGYIVSRHLDDKAGVACILAAARQVMKDGLTMPLDCSLLFTIFEEVGSGASTALHADVAEMVSVDNGVNAPNQNCSEYDVTVAMMDSSGPFDYHLTHSLLDLCQQHDIRHGRDVFRYYRSDAASAVEAGNDIRTALLCFGVDATHGYERTHIESLIRLTQLLCVYMQAPAVVARDVKIIGNLKGFPKQHSLQPPILEKRGPDAEGVPDQRL